MLSQTFHLLKTAGRPSAARLSRWQAQARSVLRRAPEMKSLTDEKLQETSRALMWRARSGEPLVNLLVENPASGEAGGIYLFADRASAEAYLAMHTARLNGFGISPVNGKLFEVNGTLSAIDRAPL